MKTQIMTSSSLPVLVDKLVVAVVMNDVSEKGLHGLVARAFEGSDNPVGFAPDFTFSDGDVRGEKELGSDTCSWCGRKRKTHCLRAFLRTTSSSCPPACLLNMQVCHEVSSLSALVDCSGAATVINNLKAHVVLDLLGWLPVGRTFSTLETLLL